ncbi:Protein CHLOROPLAST VESICULATION [Euphorbia peplus]|nr:Protein CHLOROPLAST VESICULATION [Euphorbia peplus]
MAIATRCCLNLSPPPSSSKTTHQISWLKNEKWRSQCLIGMGCVIIGVDFSIQPPNNIATAIEIRSTVAKESRNKERWSDKRICPSWNLNSLETIMPENLPRPATRRRWEPIASTKNVPPPEVQVAVKIINNDCFTL